MAYDFRPNTATEAFHMNAFSWPYLLATFGYLFPVIHQGPQWCMAPGGDPRLTGSEPEIITNDGFPVTAEESKIMARMVRNVVAIQRSLPEESRWHPGMRDEPWPVKIRNDWVDLFERFAQWLERSEGFQIW